MITIFNAFDYDVFYDLTIQKVFVVVIDDNLPKYIWTSKFVPENNSNVAMHRCDCALGAVSLSQIVYEPMVNKDDDTESKVEVKNIKMEKQKIKTLQGYLFFLGWSYTVEFS